MKEIARVGLIARTSRAGLIVQQFYPFAFREPGGAEGKQRVVAWVVVAELFIPKLSLEFHEHT
jgi:hypothetical protein